ncbi:phytochromobilin:ferredoxin oxidoreductase, chloroplastic [Dendrobium catenatum]|uniref:Phytochromobilin:ferredoxin oxidoreductase, chloroplastic n=1 Tax=Dendrobium catenatum TaxID=906689 RepID=A0A2I0X5N9_9ASPA|nr:phytochromobilin:ferredoxin oxidoreductase, chloroplastic [Dendrobium catenatum]PKU83220.1 Phytochromobilin:ferredoxin oxidoreductase, chloroplastic [Dendrobium catenatum]
MDLSAFSYQKFVQFALEETQRRTTLSPRPIQENLKCLRSKDGNATLHTLSFKAPKIRHIRSLSIEGGPSMQVLDFAAFPELKFDFPIFCANFFTTSTLSIIVLDLNPLYGATLQRDYKEKYYRSLMPLYQKYAELLPWGDKITSESLKFFSPIVIWSKINSTPQNYEVLYATFKDYFKAWLVSMELAVEAVNEMQTVCNCEAQHKYLAWRAEKDPGHPLLKRLIGENLAREMIRHFLFEGVDSLGTKTFLDYFPEYHCVDGSINQKRSIIGKAYKTRPWDAGGEFIGSKAS